MDSSAGLSRPSDDTKRELRLLRFITRVQREEIQTVGDSQVKKDAALEDKEGPEKRRQRVKEWRVVLHNDDIHT